MKKNYFGKTIKAIACAATALMMLTAGVQTVQAQQLPDPGFENWSETYNGDAQLKDWHGSNVTQSVPIVGTLRFTFMYQKEGRNGGYSAYVADKEVGAAGITEIGPGYMGLGTAWSWLDGLNTGTATAGMYGGISFKYKPDTLQVWVKRTGSHWNDEDFHIIFYSWKGTAKGTSYKNKNGGCSSVSQTDEESDIRQSTDGNECGTATLATQVAEGWLRDRKQYNDWTLIKVPLYYLNDETPEKCNVIFSAGNYPNFRANSGLYKDNALYVDDVELIYSADIDVLEVDGKTWAGFNPSSEEEQTYSLPETATAVPDIKGKRGVGSLTNTKNKTTSFKGRYLADSEMTVTKGALGEVTTITVKSADGKKTKTYKIRFVKAASTNAVPNALTYTVGGVTKTVNGFSQTNPGPFSVTLPYGTKGTPTVDADIAPGQTKSITQPASADGSATVKVTAADGKTTKTYTVNFTVEKLKDNTLQDILIDGESLAGFSPTKKNYTYTMPEAVVPTVTPVSSYADGEQTIKIASNSVTSAGGSCTIQVSAPGNTTTREYVITYKIQKSDNKYLKDLMVTGYALTPSFKSTTRSYMCSLPLGTDTRPNVTWELGDKYQTVQEVNGGVNGATTVTVTAGDGSTYVYTINFQTVKSSNCQLQAIFVNGNRVEDFSYDKAECSYALPMGTATYPSVTWTVGDEYQEVKLLNQNINGVNNIQVTAGDGTVFTYKLTLSVEKSSNTKLTAIYVGGTKINGFASATYEYSYTLPAGTTALPAVTWDKTDETQVVSGRGRGVNGDYTITVTAQSGDVQTYTIHFSVATSGNTALAGISAGGKALTDFAAGKYEYTVTLDAGVTTIPRVTATKGETSQTLEITQGNPATIKVTAENGATATYTVNFVLQSLSQNTRLEAIMVGGKLLDGFSSTTYEYSVVLPKNTTTLPAVTYTKSESTQTVTERSGGVNGDYVLTVRSEAGTFQNYTIHFSVVMSENTALKMIYLDGKSLSGFSASTTDYYIEQPEGTTTIPTVTFDKAEDEQTVTVRNKTSRGAGDYTLTVAAENKQLTKVYTLHFSVKTVEHSSNTQLQMLFIGGQAVEGFRGDVYEYWHTLPIGTTIYPAITWTAGDSEQEVSLSGPTTAGKYTIRVKAGNGAVQNYYLTMAVERASDVNLKAIYVGGSLLPDFSPEREEYTWELAAGTEEWPEVTYEKNDETQTVTPRVRINNGEGTYQLVVMSQTNDSRTYTIRFEKQKSGNTLLKMLYVGGVALAGFDPDEHVYDYTLDEGVTVIPQVTAERSEPQQRLWITQGESAHVVVYAENGDTTDYFVDFRLVLSDNVQLNLIRLDGAVLPEFMPDRYSYTVTLPANRCPAITVLKGNELQQVSISAPQGYGEAVILVTAQSGKTQEYRINFVAEAAEEAKLPEAAIKINGDLFDDFDPAQHEYYDVPYSGSNYTVSVTAGLGQTVTVVYDLSTNTVTISVTTVMSAAPAPARGLARGPVRAPAATPLAETSVVYYTLHMATQGTAAKSSNAALADVKEDGVSVLSQFDGSYHYSKTLPYGSTMPQITYTKAEEAQQVTAGLNGKNSYIIKVTAEDGASREYILEYTIPEADCTAPLALTSLSVGGTNIFVPGQSDYNLPLAQKGEVNYSLPSQGSEDIVTLLTEPDELTQQLTLQRKGCSATVVYTIHYQPAGQHTSALLNTIKVNGQILDATSATSFNVELPQATKAVPCINVESAESGQTVTIAYGKADGGEAKIHVVSEDGMNTKDYTVHFTVKKSDVATLTDLYFDGVDDFEFLVPATGFSAGVTDYTVLLKDEGTFAVPVIAYEKAEAAQRVEITQRPLGQTSEVKVTAEDGTHTTTYRITFINVGAHATTLQSVTVEGVGEVVLDADSKTVTLPFGTTGFTISDIKKGYAQQTVDISNGGLYHPTTLTVHSNNASVADKTYTLTPVVDTENPSWLQSITFTGGTIVGGFQKDKFGYVVNADAGMPTYEYTAATGADVTVETDAADYKKLVLKSVNKGYTSTYTFLFYYPNDVTFTTTFDEAFEKVERTSAPTHTGYKPKGWHAPIDAEISGDKGTYNPEDAVDRSTIIKKGVSSVKLSTKYLLTSGEAMPGIISLSEQTVTVGAFIIATHISSTLSLSGNIPFRNTPDRMSLDVYPEATNKISGWYFKYQANGTQQAKHTGNYSVVGDWQTATENIVYDDDFVPATLDIVISAAPHEDLSQYYVGNWASGVNTSNRFSSSMYVDNLRFYYNSTLTGLQVNGVDATLSGNAFAVSVPEYDNLPELTFTGEVKDQAQQITWYNEVNAVRTATIRNFAEDGTYTDYTLTVTRAKNAQTALAGITLSKGDLIFDAAQTDYTVSLEEWNGILPDVTPVLDNARQQVAVSRSGNTVTITVTAESGNTRTYTLTFTDTMQSELEHTLTANNGATVTLSGDSYRVAVDEEKGMPDLTVELSSLTQTAVQTANSIRIVAADGTEKTYAVLYVLPATENTLETVEGIAGFFSGTTTYTAATLPATTCFERTYARDSVFQTIAPDKLTWQVVNATDASLSTTYTLSLQATTLSDSKLLADILVDNVSVDAPASFNAWNTEHEVPMSRLGAIKVVKESEAQQVSISSTTDAQGNIVYTIHVVAEDGSEDIAADYHLTFRRELSDDTGLDAISVNGQEQPCTAGQYDYTFVLPLADANAPKTAQQTITSLTYKARNGQQVEMQVNPVGQISYLWVKAENGDEAEYHVMVTAEPSHYAYLSEILVNGAKVADPFVPAQTEYTITGVEQGTPQILIGTDDCYQTIAAPYADAADPDIWYVDVTAEDGTTIVTYTLNLVRRELSHEPFLADIRLDGMSLEDFAAAGKGTVMPDAFSRYNTYYTVELADRTKPDVSMSLNGDAALRAQRVEGDSVIFDVVAEDGTTELTYIVVLHPYKEQDATLLDILVDGRPISDFGVDFQAGQGVYQVVLPESYTVYPMVEPVSDSELHQQILLNTDATGSLTTIAVTAEDGVHTMRYNVLLEFTPSTADTLMMIYENGQPLDGFDSKTYVYTRTLSVGTREYPHLEAVLDIRDEGRTEVQPQTLYEETYRACYQFLLTAESGATNIYTVNYLVEKSVIDTLQMMYVDGMEYPEFNSRQTAYEMVLPVGSSFPASVTGQPGDDWQTISTAVAEAADGLSKQFLLTVTAEAGNINTYSLTCTIRQSAADTLTMIYADDKPLDTFAPHTFAYAVALPAGTRTWPVLEAEIDPEAIGRTEVEQTTLEEDLYRKTTQFTVTAENGSKNVYTVSFTVLKSEADTLLMIYEDGQPLDGFTPLQTEYSRTLSVGTRQYPVLEARLSDEVERMQLAAIVPDTLYEDAYQATYRFTVTAENGSIRNYTVAYTIEQSAADTLLAIYDAETGFSIDGFEPRRFTYDIALPVGQTTIPDMDYEQADQWQTVQKQTADIEGGRQYTFLVTAENGNTNLYVVNCRITLSAADTLLMIYSGNEQLTGFEPHTFVYDVTLPVGTKQFPVVAYDLADQWQTVDSVSTTAADGYSRRYEIAVTAANGSSNTYVLGYTIAKSDCDTLLYISLDGQLLSDFRGTQNDYSVVLPLHTTAVPDIAFERADEAQQVTVQTNGVDGVSFITVKAENGAVRTYTIRFSVALSSNCYLEMLRVSNQDIADFDPTYEDYTVNVLYGAGTLPFITWQKAEEVQQVTLAVDTLVAANGTDSIVAVISVTAEDGTRFDYTIRFRQIMSDNADLLMLYLDGEPLYGFRKDSFEYVLPKPWTFTTMPDITWLTLDEQQDIRLEKTSPLSANVIVTSGDGENVNTYAIIFDRELCPINRLDSLCFHGALVEGFHPDTLTYRITYPFGTSPEHLADTTAVTYAKGEEHETVQVRLLDDYTLSILVTAENPDSVRAYSIMQVILPSPENRLADLQVDGVTIDGFSPETYFYEYRLMTNRQDMPMVEGFALDTLAEVYYQLGDSIGDTTYVHVQAEDGSERIYAIWFHYADIDYSATVSEKSVLLKQIPGTNQFVAYSIRRNVQIAFYDPNGSVILFEDVPLCDPNAAKVVSDYSETDVLYDVDSSAEGVILTLELEKVIYYYAFFENRNRRIASGKLMIVR